MLCVQERSYPIALAAKRYSVIANLVKDLPDNVFQIELPEKLTEAELDWLFGEALATQPTTELKTCLDFLDGSKRLIGDLKERTDHLPALSYSLATRYQWLDLLSKTDRLVEETRSVSQELLEDLFVPCQATVQEPWSSLLPPQSDRWVVAGGCVLNALSQVQPDSDLDIFLYEQDLGAMQQLLDYYQEWAQQRGLRAIIGQRKHLITLAIERQPMIQLILTTYSNPFDLVQGFDASPVQCFLHNGYVAASVHCLESLESRLILDYDPEIRPGRIGKFLERGYRFQPEPNVNPMPYPIQKLALDWTRPTHELIKTFADHHYGRDGVGDLSSFSYAMPEAKPALIDYWHDQCSNQIRACQLPSNWLQNIALHSADFNQFFKIDRITYQGRQVIFDLEPHQLERKAFHNHLRPIKAGVNPARRSDTEALLDTIEQLERDLQITHHTVIYGPDYLHWNGDRTSYLLKLSPPVALCDQHGEQLQRFKDDERLESKFFDKPCLIRVKLVGVLRPHLNGSKLFFKIARAILQ